jgi:hypothetical protein
MRCRTNEQKTAAIRPINDPKKGMEEAMMKAMPVRKTTSESQVNQWRGVDVW